MVEVGTRHSQQNLFAPNFAYTPPLIYKKLFSTPSSCPVYVRSCYKNIFCNWWLWIPIIKGTWCVVLISPLSLSRASSWTKRSSYRWFTMALSSPYWIYSTKIKTKQMRTKDFTLASNFSKVLYRTCMQLQIGLHLTRDSFSQLCTDERIRNDILLTGTQTKDISETTSQTNQIICERYTEKLANGPWYIRDPKWTKTYRCYLIRMTCEVIRITYWQCT